MIINDHHNQLYNYVIIVNTIRFPLIVVGMFLQHTLTYCSLTESVYIRYTHTHTYLLQLHTNRSSLMSELTHNKNHVTDR